MKTTCLLVLFSAVILVGSACRPTKPTSPFEAKAQALAKAKALEGFVIEDEGVYAEYGETSYNMLLKKQASWKDVFAQLKAEFPNARATEYTRRSGGLLAQKDGDLLWTCNVGPGSDQRETIETVQVQQTETSICSVYISVASAEGPEIIRPQK